MPLPLDVLWVLAGAVGVLVTAGFLPKGLMTTSRSTTISMAAAAMSSVISCFCCCCFLRRLAAAARLRCAWDAVRVPWAAGLGRWEAVLGCTGLLFSLMIFLPIVQFSKGMACIFCRDSNQNPLRY